MDLYKVLKPIELNKGAVVQLSKEQALPRLKDIKPLKDNKYDIKSAIQFKCGEIIGLDVLMTKRFAGMIEPVQPKEQSTKTEMKRQT